MKNNCSLLRMGLKLIVVLTALLAAGGIALADELYSVSDLNPDGTAAGIQYAAAGEMIVPPEVTAVTGSRTYTAVNDQTQSMYTLTIKRVCSYGPTLSTETVQLPNGATYIVDNETYIKNYENYSTGTREIVIDGADVEVTVWYTERHIPLKVYCMLDGEYVAPDSTNTRYLSWFADYERWGIGNYYDRFDTYRPYWEFKGYYGAFAASNASGWMLGETLDTMEQCIGASFKDSGTDLTYSTVNAEINDLAEAYYLVDSRATFYTVTFQYPSDLTDPDSEIIATQVVVRKGDDAQPPVTAEGWGWDSTAYQSVSGTCTVNLVQGTTVAVPEANTGLVYCAEMLCGVPDGDGYTLSGQYAVDAETHQAAATLAEGCFWPDGSPSPRTISYTIDPAPLTLTGVTGTLIYNGEAQTLQGLNVSGLACGEHQVSGIEWSATGTKKGSYTGSFSGACAVSDADGADVTANYTVTRKNGRLTIAARDIADAVIVLDQTPMYYDGAAKTPAVVSAVLDGLSLVENTDYTVAYSDNIQAGAAKAVLTGKGNYTGSAAAEFTILQPADISGAVITLEATEYDWDNTARTPAVTVELDGAALTEGEHYTVTYADNTSAGTATVTAEGIGAYCGTVQAQFAILPRDLSGAAVTLAATELPYADCAQEAGVASVMLGGEALSAADYSVTYENNVNVGTATAIVTGRGNYCGSVTAAFEIYSVHRAAQPDTGEIVEWAAMETAVVHEGVNHIFLSADTADSFSVGDGETLYLDLNGHTLRARCAFTVGDGGRLVLCDSVGTGTVTHDGDSNGCAILLSGTGAADMYGGTITGYEAESYAYQGGVHLSEGGTFNLYGGEISDCSVYYSGYGGGIYCYKGTLGIHGGTITGCTAHYGGGVYAYKSDLTITGGSIAGNTAYRGGGVYYGNAYNSDPYRFTMTGGTVSGNTAYEYGGGMKVYYSSLDFSGGTIRDNAAANGGGGISGMNGIIGMSGSASVSGNTVGESSGMSTAAKGAGIYISSGSLTMNGGSISDNTVYGLGGGVYINGSYLSRTLLMNGGEISGNTAAAGNHSFAAAGGGVYLDSSAAAKLYGGKIAGNAANGRGSAGGVYAPEGVMVSLKNGVVIAGNDADDDKPEIYPAIPVVEGALSGEIGAGVWPESMRQVAVPAEGYCLTAEDAAAFVTDSGETGYVRAWDNSVYVGEETRYALVLNGAELTGAAQGSEFTAGTLLELRAVLGENQILAGWHSSDAERPIEGAAAAISVMMPDQALSIDALILEGVGIEDQLYTGAEICPEIAPVLNGVALEEGVDYTLTWSDNIDAGTAWAEIASVNAPAWTVKVEFEILPVAVTVTGAAASAVYDGAEHAANGWTAAGLPEGMTLSGIEWSAAAVNAGSYEGAFSGEALVVDASGADITRNCSFEWINGCLTIEPASLAGAEIWLLEESLTYNGQMQIPEILVYMGNAELIKDVDFTVRGENNISAGRAELVIEGMGNYIGEASAGFRITPADVGGAQLVFEETELTYAAAPVEAEFKVILNENELAEQTDYTVKYADNIAAGLASVTVSGTGNYTGVLKGTFTISMLDISQAQITAADVTANGTAQQPVLTVTAGEAVLSEGTDYTAVWSDNLHVGTACVELTGIGSCFGSAGTHFAILPADLAEAEVLIESDPVYSGEAQLPVFSVNLNGWRLEEGEHFTVSVENNINAGEAAMLLEGTGDCTGAKECAFTILQKPVDGAVISAEDCVYTGGAQTPGVTVLLGGVLLSAETDCSIVYENNTDAGAAKVLVTGKGNYCGEAAGSFEIQPASLEGAMMLVSALDAVYTGEPIVPRVLVLLGGVRLNEGVDYALTFSDNVNAGEATVIAAGCGNYTGSVQGSFAIACASMADAQVGAVPGVCIATGNALRPTVIVTLNGKALTEEVDYRLEFAGDAEEGTCTILAVGIGNLTGTATGGFDIFDGSAMKSGAMPAAIRRIGDEAFAASAFERIVIPEGCEAIGARAFADCAALTVVVVPDTVLDIADDAFEGSNACIYTPVGSHAQAWAAGHGIACVGELMPED